MRRAVQPLLTVLAAGLVAFAAPHARAEPAARVRHVHVGRDGLVPSGANPIVDVEIESTGHPFEGRFEGTWGADASDRIVVDLRLAAGESCRRRVLVPDHASAAAFPVALEWRLADRSGRSIDVGVARATLRRTHVLRLGASSPAAPSDGSLHVPFEEIPDRAQDYAGWNVIVISRDDVARLDERRRRLLLDRASLGATVVVASAPALAGAPSVPAASMSVAWSDGLDEIRETRWGSGVLRATSLPADAIGMPGAPAAAELASRPGLVGARPLEAWRGSALVARPAALGRGDHPARARQRAARESADARIAGLLAAGALAVGTGALAVMRASRADPRVIVVTPLGVIGLSLALSALLRASRPDAIDDSTVTLHLGPGPAVERRFLSAGGVAGTAPARLALPDDPDAVVAILAGNVVHVAADGTAHVEQDAWSSVPGSVVAVEEWRTNEAREPPLAVEIVRGSDGRRARVTARGDHAVAALITPGGLVDLGALPSGTAVEVPLDPGEPAAASEGATRAATLAVALLEQRDLDGDCFAMTASADTRREVMTLQRIPVSP